MQGSEKQVRWAEQIQRDMLEALEFEIRLSSNKALFMDRWQQLVAAKQEAKWWIDHRRAGVRDLLRGELLVGMTRGRIGVDDIWSAEAVR